MILCVRKWEEEIPYVLSICLFVFLVHFLQFFIFLVSYQCLKSVAFLLLISKWSLDNNDIERIKILCVCLSVLFSSALLWCCMRQSHTVRVYRTSERGDFSADCVKRGIIFHFLSFFFRSILPSRERVSEWVNERL